MSRSRSTVNLAKLAGFLKDTGLVPLEVTLQPDGAVSAKFGEGENLTSAEDLAAITRSKVRIGQYGKRRKAA